MLAHDIAQLMVLVRQEETQRPAQIVKGGAFEGTLHGPFGHGYGEGAGEGGRGTASGRGERGDRAAAGEGRGRGRAGSRRAARSERGRGPDRAEAGSAACVVAGFFLTAQLRGAPIPSPWSSRCEY